MDLLTFLPATVLGFEIFKRTSHPSHRLAKFRPHIKLWRIQLSPSVRLFIRGRVIHLHHWLSLSVILSFSVFLNLGFLDYTFAKGFMLGGVLQGLTFPDFKNVIYRVSDYTNIISMPSTTEVPKETS